MFGNEAKKEKTRDRSPGPPDPIDRTDNIKFSEGDIQAPASASGSAGLTADYFFDFNLPATGGNTAELKP